MTVVGTLYSVAVTTSKGKQKLVADWPEDLTLADCEFGVDTLYSSAGDLAGVLRDLYISDLLKPDDVVRVEVFDLTPRAASEGEAVLQKFMQKERERLLDRLDNWEKTLLGL